MRAWSDGKSRVGNTACARAHTHENTSTKTQENTLSHARTEVGGGKHGLRRREVCRAHSQGAGGRGGSGLRPARAQPLPRGQTAWSAALCVGASPRRYNCPYDVKLLHNKDVLTQLHVMNYVRNAVRLTHRASCAVLLYTPGFSVRSGGGGAGGSPPLRRSAGRPCCRGRATLSGPSGAVHARSWRVLCLQASGYFGLARTCGGTAERLNSCDGEEERLKGDMEGAERGRDSEERGGGCGQGRPNEGETEGRIEPTLHPSAA